ncbi:MAG: sugar ABC transporter permease [Chloroflexi bacterium]|nr:sugar ABC transporter permease [Chloroflexota bacterium]
MAQSSAITSVAVEKRFLARHPSRRPWGAIALFLGPIMLYYAIFIMYPLAATLYYSVHSIEPTPGQPGLTTTYVGTDNFEALEDDWRFERAVKNTVKWGLIGPVLEIATALTLAMVVYFKVPFWRFYRIAWFTPMLVSGVIVGLVWRWIFNYDWGLLNTFLREVHLEEWAIDWLGARHNRNSPLGAVIFVHYWATFGFSFVLLLAGLTAIDEEVIDAARVDGANTLQVVVRILLPLLRPTLITVLILSFMGKMRAFNVVWVLTNGGPIHLSETVATYVQKRAFGWRTLDLGYPSAIAVAWFGVVLVGVMIIRTVANRLSRQ